MISSRWGFVSLCIVLSIVWIHSAAAVDRAAFIQSVRSGELPETGFHCATCEYLLEQKQRVRDGKKPVVNPLLVPEEYWSDSSGITPLDAFDWPERYFSIDQDRTDEDGDGLLEARYTVDFSAFIPDGAYTQAQVDSLLDILDRCIAIYNEALQHVGLEFREVNDGSHHITISATTNSSLGNSTGLATLFGAIQGSDPFLYLRSTYARFGAALPSTDNGAPTAFGIFPPGNPFAIVFPPSSFREMHNGSELSKVASSSTILHELGHLIGLRHPFDAYGNLSTGQAGYLVDWLAWPTVGNPPPAAPSTVFGGEPFDSTQWSRGLYNTFMTYDDGSDRVVYPDLPAPVKAYIAHYYGIQNPSSAQVLLDEALAELYDRSPVVRGEMILEAEPNDTPVQAVPVQAGLPVLAALAKAEPSDPFQFETFEDRADWYALPIAEADVGRIVDLEVGLGSLVYETFFYTRGFTEYDGIVELVVQFPDGSEMNSGGDEFPAMSFTPSQAGTYFIAVQDHGQNTRVAHKDYVLNVQFQDGFPGNAPSLPPTPTPTPFIPNPDSTPIAAIQQIDGAITDTYITIPDGDNSILNDPVIENPQPGQTIRFNARFQNIGLNPIPSQSYEMFVNGQRHASSSYTTSMPVGQTLIWQTRDYQVGNAGIYEYEWRFTVEGDGNPDNNVATGQFPVGNTTLPTSTPPPTPTPTNTPVPTSTPTIVILPTPTNAPVQPTLPASDQPEPILSYTFGEGDLVQNGIVEIPGTFSGIPAARSSIITTAHPGGETLGVSGHALQVDANTGEGTMLLLSGGGAVDASRRIVVRASGWANTIGVQVYLGLIDTDAAGNLTGTGLSLLNLGTGATLNGSWDRLVTIHKSGSGFMIPFLQVVGGADGSVVQFDAIEVYRIEPGTTYDASFFGEE